ncbi:alpha/beta fold hydrolase [Nocardia kruczakiae]|uniref:alpha/beta fold hydrolase n=1 Tax=Nocardia kruczakiae TaxID=261477 RepID=UPI0007A3FE84|nr:alpha/beta fold hydrolase [Nocardia kruczakiae]
MDTFTHAGFVFDVTDTPAPSGSATPETVVLLHGFPEDRHCWDAITPTLAAAGYRVLAPDLRGYSPGARPAERSAYATARMTGDVYALADAAGAERFHLVGHDWGAALAWSVAAERPDRLMSLTALSVPHPMAFARAMVTSSQALRSWYMAACQLPSLPELVLSAQGGRPMRQALIRAGLDAESANRYAARAAHRGDMRGPVNWYRGLPFALRRPVGSVDVPTLFCWGTADRYVTRSAAQACGRYVTGPYRYEALDGGSHWLPEQDSDRVAALLLDHLRAALAGVAGRP